MGGTLYGVWTRLGGDARPSTRASFLDLINQHAEPYRTEIITIALHDPEFPLRIKASQLIASCVPSSEQGPIFQQLSRDPNPQVRLFAFCMLALAGDADALKECIRRVTEPQPEAKPFDRHEVLEAIKSTFASLERRCDDTRKAAVTSPERLRQVGEEWKA